MKKTEIIENPQNHKDFYRHIALREAATRQEGKLFKWDLDPMFWFCLIRIELKRTFVEDFKKNMFLIGR